MKLPRLVSPAAACLLAACSSLPDFSSAITPYRIDVRQGNFVTQEMVGQLKPGMTKDQVRFVLGTPLVTDMFHGERWDYIYRFQPGHGEAQRRHVTVFFEDGKLARVAGDVVASQAGAKEAEGAAATRSRIIEIGSAAQGKPDEAAPPADGKAAQGGKPSEGAAQEQDKK